jgi:hypothetical protein
VDDRWLILRGSGIAGHADAAERWTELTIDQRPATFPLTAAKPSERTRFTENKSVNGSLALAEPAEGAGACAS